MYFSHESAIWVGLAHLYSTRHHQDGSTETGISTSKIDRSHYWQIGVGCQQGAQLVLSAGDLSSFLHVTLHVAA